MPFRKPRGKAVVSRSYVGKVVSDSILKMESPNKPQLEVDLWKEISRVIHVVGDAFYCSLSTISYELPLNKQVGAQSFTNPSR